MGIKVNPRSRLVSAAQVEMEKYAGELQQRLQLTDIELLLIISYLPTAVLKHMLRHERHPNEPDKPADQE